MAKKCCANCEHSNCTLSCGAYEIWECKALVLIENHNPVFPVSKNFCCSWWNKPYEVVRKEYGKNLFFSDFFCIFVGV